MCCLAAKNIRNIVGLVNINIFFFQAEDGIRDHCVTGVQTCALPIWMQHGEVQWIRFHPWHSKSFENAPEDHGKFVLQRPSMSRYYLCKQLPRVDLSSCQLSGFQRRNAWMHLRTNSSPRAWEPRICCFYSSSHIKTCCSVSPPFLQWQENTQMRAADRLTQFSTLK